MMRCTIGLDEVYNSPNSGHDEVHNSPNSGHDEVFNSSNSGHIAVVMMWSYNSGHDEATIPLTVVMMRCAIHLTVVMMKCSIPLTVDMMLLKAYNVSILFLKSWYVYMWHVPFGAWDQGQKLLKTFILILQLTFTIL